jgi:hypothetical protein
MPPHSQRALQFALHDATQTLAQISPEKPAPMGGGGGRSALGPRSRARWVKARATIGSGKTAPTSKEAEFAKVKKRVKRNLRRPDRRRFNAMAD